jgi:NAD(P)-dependent dehydrogenase (short-subunit alcohol dehydrogenase family)
MSSETSAYPLDGRVALVTGASRGIGAAIARAFSAAGAAVAMASRDAAALDRLASALADAGGRPLAVPTDVTDPDQVAHMVERTVNAFGRLDVACNTASGGGHGPTPLADVPVEDFDSGIAVSLRGMFLGLKHEIPAMLASGGGAIVNTSSTAGLDAVAGLAAYVSAKHGLEGLTKVAALDYAEQGVRVNAIAPGPVLTGTLQRLGPDAQHAAAASLPMRRIGRVEEVAAAAVWLCSDEAAFVTGTTLVIDGGLLAGIPPFSRR